MKRQSTTVLKPAQVARKWFLFDASRQPLGRLATAVARKLIDKDSPHYTPHVDSGHHVIVINANQLIVTGDKLRQKQYYRHSQHPGSLKQTNLGAQVEQDAKKVVEHAIKGMLPKNKLQSSRMARLHVYNDDQHGHNAQKPSMIEAEGGR